MCISHKVIHSWKFTLVLAIGYSCAKVVLCDVENSAKLHNIEFECGVSSIKWVAEQEKPDSDGESSTEVDCFHECAATYLPRLPNFPKT